MKPSVDFLESSSYKDELREMGLLLEISECVSITAVIQHEKTAM